MASRFYQSCPQCGQRMVMFCEDSDGDRRHYLCRECGARRTLIVSLNGLSAEWPTEVFDEAVRQQVITRDGAVI